MPMEHLCFSEFRRLPHTAEDPVAVRTGWTLLVAGGELGNNELVETGARIAAKRSTGSTSMYLLPVVLFGALLLGAGLLALANGEWLGGAIALLLAGVLAKGAATFLKRDCGLTLDLPAGVYHRGRAWRAQPLPASEQGALSAVHAVQVLAAEVASMDPDTRVTTTSTRFEVNLVLDDGARVNVLDHGRSDRMMQAARMLSERLRVPLWAATC